MEFIDLKAQYERIKDDVRRRIDAVLEHGKFIMGPEVYELEERLADYVGVKHCITCASGTDALLLPLMAKNIGPGDIVFTTPFTFIATAEVIALLGATPLFVDIDPHTYNIDPKKLEEAIINVKNGIYPTTYYTEDMTPKAIIAVDLFGLPADYTAIEPIAKKHGLYLIEDAAQGFGGSIDGKKAGSFGDVAATSFFPAKPLGCYGDGGAIFTDDDGLADIIRSIRIHGKGTDKYDNVRVGINGRLDTLQAAVILAKMVIFDDEVEKRQQVASWYGETLRGTIKKPFVADGYRSAWAQYTVRTDNRAILVSKLKDVGIPTAIYYPKTLHLQTTFERYRYVAGSLPLGEEASMQVFSLPMHSYLTLDQAEGIAQAITD